MSDHPPAPEQPSTTAEAAEVAAPPDPNGTVERSGPRPRLLMAAVVMAAIAIGAVVAVAIGFGGDRADEQAAFAGSRRLPIPTVDQQTLPAVEPDGSEREFTFRAGDDELLLVYFGYTSCPDVCPTTMSDVAKVADAMGPDGDRLDVAMVTIDPEVDTPEVLSAYARSFIPDATAIRTLDDARLRASAELFGADYGTLEGPDGEPQVYHTGSLYAVDQAGRLLMTWPFGITKADLQRDLERLLVEASTGEIEEATT